jgi:hypothetical protein
MKIFRIEKQKNVRNEKENTIEGRTCGNESKKLE